MTAWLLRLARWIAGPDRTGWADAMAAETEAAGAQSTSWAWGCLAASLRDRVTRERAFLLSILLVPVGAFLFSMIVFFGVAWLWRHAGLSAAAFSAIMASAPLPFAYYLGTIQRRRAALVAASLCFFSYHAIPLIMFWIEFGKTPLSWMSADTVVYGLSALPGYALGLSVWLVGAWWGSRRTRKASV